MYVLWKMVISIHVGRDRRESIYLSCLFSHTARFDSSTLYVFVLVSLVRRVVPSNLQRSGNGAVSFHFISKKKVLWKKKKAGDNVSLMWDAPYIPYIPTTN